MGTYLGFFIYEGIALIIIGILILESKGEEERRREEERERRK